MVLTYTILEKERRSLTIWCKVEYYANGEIFTIDVPITNPQSDEEVYEKIYNSGVSYLNTILDEYRLDQEILPNIQ